MNSDPAAEPIAGIDLGTTHSLIGIVEAGFPILLADRDGSRLTPSVVYYGPHGEPPKVGREAWRRRILEGGRTVVSVKRWIGRRPGDEGGATPENSTGVRLEPGARGGWDAVVDGIPHSPVEISAEILKHLKKVAEEALGHEINRAVITVPAYFHDGQRQATREAGQLAGFVVERILNEPTAAALAFGLDKLGERSRIAVYDFGGGTFDVSLLEMQEGIFQVLSTHGDTRLGGDDLDRAFAAWLAERLREELDGPSKSEGPSGWAALSVAEQGRVLEAAQEAKHALSFSETAEVRLPFWRGDRSFLRTVHRHELESLISPLVSRTRELCRKALLDARLEAADLQAVVLVGGSTRIPLVRRLAREIFGKDPDTSQHPDETVALGAVIQAGVLSGAMRQLVLLDVTPLSLGIETFGGLMNVILPRNTTIPAKAGEMFTNAVTNQPGMRIRVLQGEREMARDNWQLGEFEVGFAPGPRGSARVGVQFEIDADGILKVLARDTKTGRDEVVEIRHAAVDVHESKVEEMIAESVDHAFEDMAERQWTEASLKAAELLDATGQALSQAGDVLNPPALVTIRAAVEAVESARMAGNLARLKSANAALDAATEPLAAILVERAMEAALDRRLGLGSTDAS